MQELVVDETELIFNDLVVFNRLKDHQSKKHHKTCLNLLKILLRVEFHRSFQK